MGITIHGIDLVHTPRIEHMLRAHGQHFLDRIFTRDEQDYCIGRREQSLHLAARFAAKEATLKALGTGLTGGIAWTDISIAREGSGAPCLVLIRQAQVRASELGVNNWLVSLSHAGEYATASVIGLAS